MTTIERIAAFVLALYPRAFRRSHGREFHQFARTLQARCGTRAALLTLARDGARSLPREWFRTISPEWHMRTFIDDARFAVRLLARAPGFTVAAIATLALGIGANTAVFTLADAALLRPVHVRNPGQLVVWSWSSAYPDFVEYTKRTDVFEGVAAFSGAGRLTLSDGGAADLVPGAFLSGNALDVLGVPTAIGRPIVASDDVANGPIVVLLGHEYWRTRFGGDPSVIGRSVRLNGKPATIVGVLRESFRGLSVGATTAVYIPTACYNQVQTGFFSRMNALTANGFVWLTVIGRLRHDVPVERANTTMTALYAQLHPSSSTDKREQLDLQPLESRALGARARDIRRFLGILAAVVGLTLLVGCANLANLLLARTHTRRREVAVRLALGATRTRVVLQLLIETLVLAAAGGVVALALAAACLELLSAYQLPGGIPIQNLRLGLNGAALASAAVLSLLTALAFGTLPAWRASRGDVVGSLRGDTRTSTPSGTMRGVLLSVQVALSLVLLAGTGLFARSLRAALDVPLGFTPSGVLTASVNAGLARYDEGRAVALYDTALSRVRALPQVDSAAWATMIPTRGSWMNQTRIDGHTPRPGEEVTINMSQVGPACFRAIGARVLSGREFGDEDVAGGMPVAVVNKAMADTYWAGRSALGGRFEQFNQWVTIVGIVEDAVTDQLDGRRRPFAYLNFNQWLTGKQGAALDPAHLFVRVRGMEASSVTLLRDQLRGIDPQLPLYDVGPLAERVALLRMPQQMGATLFALFSGIALALAAVGIYGVASYVAAMRKREIGVRLALGANRAAVRRLVLIQGAVPIAAGIAAGLAAGLTSSVFVRPFLINVSPTDPATFAAMSGLVALVGLIAGYLPARRAARLDPVDALRDD